MTCTRLFVLLLGVALAGFALAQPPTVGVQIDHTEITQRASGAPTIKQTEIGKTALNPTDHAEAKIWGLDVQEYSRYRLLMRGMRGSFSVPNISPLEVLGIHAESPAERRKYAEHLVRLRFEDIERVNAWERETQATWRHLYPNVPMFDPKRLPQTAAVTPGPLVGKRLALFVSTACPSCKQAMPPLLKLAGEGGPAAGLDIYVVDSDDPAFIRAFARESGVDPQLVRRKRITINRGRALFSGLSSRVVPQVFVRDGDRLIPIPGLMPGDSS